MSREQHQPMSMQSHRNVALQIFLELHRRINGNKFGQTPTELCDDAWSMRAYCLDAHDLLPAGSTRYYRFGPDDYDWIPEPTHCMRDGEQP